MNTSIFEWSNDCFCSGCIVYAMVNHQPWSQWLEEHDLSDYTTAEALASMVTYFDLADKPRSTRTAMGFPVRINSPEGTIFCAVCLSLLHQVP